MDQHMVHDPVHLYISHSCHRRASFIQNVKSAAYSIGKQVDRNLGKSEQEFMPDEFAVPEEKSEKPAKNKKSPER